MKNKILLLLVASSLSLSVTAQFNIDQFKKKGTGIISGNTGTSNLSNADIVKGLKEALTIGAKNSGAKAAQLNGYFKNPKIFIPFPKDAQKIESTLRNLGYGKKIDEFTLTLNRAAEEAAKEAAPIFLNAITSMSINDALGILKGNEIAATTYLKGNTQNQLLSKFKPIVDKALLKTKATRYWSDLVNIYNKLPTVRQKVNPDLSAYASGKAIDGLFILVGEEEAKIRKDPAAQVTDILKKVFGKK